MDRIARWREEINPTIRDGWLGTRVWEVVRLIGEWQAAHSVVGDIVEIGVYYGKFLFLLDALRGEGESTWAVDLFEAHVHNVEAWPQSGVKDHTYYPAWFRRDVEKWGEGRIELVACDSITLPVGWLRGKVKLFSLDGNPAASHVFMGLVSASEALVPGGVVAVDDYMNPGCPGVAEGVIRYLSHMPRLAPVLYFQNKLFMTTLGQHYEMFDYFLDRLADPEVGLERDVLCDWVFARAEIPYVGDME